MLNIRRKKHLLLVPFMVAVMIASVGSFPVFAGNLQIYTGRITLIKGEVVTLDGYKRFEPASVRAEVPKWAEEGTRVKVGYYSQQLKNYYYEIGKPGKKLEAEKKEEARTRADH